MLPAGLLRGRPDLADLARLLGYVRPYLWQLGLATLFSVLYSSSIVGRAALLQPLMDQVVLPAAAERSLESLSGPEQSAAEIAQNRAQLNQNLRSNLRQLLLAAAGLLLLLPLARLGRDYATDWLVTRLHVDLQQRVGEKLLRLPLARHQHRGSGDFLARFSSDTQLATRAQLVVFSDGLHNSAMVISAVAVAVYACWQLALVTLLAGPPILLVMRAFGHRIRRSSAARQSQISEVVQRVLQMLAGIKVIQAFGAEERERETFAREVERYFRKALRVVRNRVYSRSLVEFASQLSFMAMLLVGIFATLSELWGLTPGRLMAFVTITAALYRPAKSGADVYNTLQDALPAVHRLFEILDAAEREPDPPGAAEPVRLERGIRFEKVCFSYDRERVLDELDLEIRAGEVVALVGRTGAGKTTIIDLLLRFYEPAAGRIALDEVDLRQIRRASLHRLFAVVTQEPFLFHDTILENIRYGNRAATMKEVEEAARGANAHEFIARLPLGYDTHVGQAGSLLSGGERQRITIARAMLLDPQVLIFDEATSSLDAKAEQSVQEATANLMRGRTVLIIAHRLVTVRSADRICVLEGGRITQSGSHAELMARPGLYRELVALQLAREAPGAAGAEPG
jgi:ATP-binding cassette, subfamily B, bacterial MsbA